MLPDRVSNPGPLTYESGTLPIALRGPAGITVPTVLDTLSCATNCLQRKTTFMTSCLLPWETRSFQKGSILKKIICSYRSKLFSLRLDPNEKSDTSETYRVSVPEVYGMHLRGIHMTLLV